MVKFLVSMATVASVVLAAGDAHAGYVIYSGVDNNGNPGLALSSTPNSTAAENAFKSNLVGAGTENFESRSGSAPLVLDFGVAGTATLTGAGNVASTPAGTSNGVGRYSVPGGTQYWETNGGGSFQINFSQEVAAFGFYGIDMGDFAGTLALQFLDSAANVISTLSIPTAATNVADGSVLYFGVIAGDDSELFQTVRFITTSGSGDVFGVDSFTIGSKEQVSAVPEPTTFALLGLGMLGFAASRRKAATQR